MEVVKQEAATDNKNSSMSSIVEYIKEQGAYLKEQDFLEKSKEINQKDEIIRKILTEKSEIEQKFEILEARETETRKEIANLKEVLIYNK